MADGQEGQIEVLNPQGQAGNIPLEQMDDALGQGYKLSKHAIMYDPQGKRGLVPKEQMADAMKQGYQTTPETSFEKERPGRGISTEGMGRAAWETTKGFGQAALNMVDPTRGLSGAGLAAIGMNPREGAANERLNEIPIVGAAREAKYGFEHPLGGPVGVNFPSTSPAIASGVVSGLGGLMGVSGERMAEHGERGEGGAILGEAAIPAAAAIAGPVAERGATALARRARPMLAERSLAKSTREIKEAAPPGRHEINYDAQLERARPYLAEEQHAAPVKSVREAHEVANAAVQGIEGKIGSYIDQLPETDRVSGKEILARATKKLNDPGSPRTPAERAAGIKELEGFLTEEPGRTPKDLSVKEADRLRWRFNRDMDTEMGMTEADRADVRASNPKFAAKEAAAEALRDAVYDKLSEAGVPGIDKIRGDEGAVLQMRDAFRRNITRSEKSNAPSAFRRLGVFGPVGLGFLGETLASRLGVPPGVSAGLGIGTAGLYEYLRNRMTPNPLIERGFGRLGKSGLAPNFPTMPIQGQVVEEPSAAAAAPPIAREVAPEYPQLTEYAGRERTAPPPATGAEATGTVQDERVLARGGGIRQAVRGLLPERAGEPPPAEPLRFKGINPRSSEEVMKPTTLENRIQALRDTNLDLKEAIRKGKGTTAERAEAEKRIEENNALIKELESRGTE